jgi:hypothetical protein
MRAYAKLIWAVEPGIKEARCIPPIILNPEISISER